MSRNIPWYEVLVIKFFGQKTVHYSGLTRVVSYQFRNKTYNFYD